MMQFQMHTVVILFFYFVLQLVTQNKLAKITFFEILGPPHLSRSTQYIAISKCLVSGY